MPPKTRRTHLSQSSGDPLSELNQATDQRSHDITASPGSQTGLAPVVVTSPTSQIVMDKNVTPSTPRRTDQSAEIDSLPAINTDFQKFAIYIKSQFNDFSTRLADMESRLEDRLTALEIENNTLRESLTRNEKSMQVMDSRLKSCERKLEEAERREVENEQYSRKSSIRIFGLPSAKKNEDAKRVVCDFVNNSKLKLDPPLQAEAIDIAHRVGRPSPKDTQTMICKFMRRTDKERVIKFRKRLSGSKMGISDDIAKSHLDYMEELRKRQDITDVWFFDGKIFAKPVDCTHNILPRLYCNIEKLIFDAKARPPLKRH